ncbi:methyl-accepting chemotaxis protein [Heyndrickxia sp. NPDC080065]|uniref:methyl-accepting chemotaxis protein n=1 Tax=Heyndrickxia sp. NPDC080065 TaxID=3390568 RepID=UPI003CFC610E
MKRRNISTKVSLVLFVVIAIVLTATAAIVNVYTKNIMTANIEKEVKVESKSVADKVNNFFEGKGQLVDSITSNQTVLHYLNTAKTRNEALTNKYYKDMNQSLEAIKSMNPDVAMVWVASEKGNFLTGTGNVLSGTDFDLAERPWFKPVTNAEGVYYTEPYMDQVFGKVIMSVMKEVKVNNESVGIVAVDIFLDSIPSIMEQYKIGKTGYSILIAPNGNVIYHPKKKLILKNLTSQKGDIGSIAKKMVAGKTGLETVKLDNEKYYIGYKPVESTGWSVATTVTQNEVFEPLNGLTVKLIIFFTITIVILVSITYLLLKYMLKNLTGMSQIIKKISAGDLTHRLDIRTKDELGQVSNDLNEMLDNLNGLIRTVQINSSQVAASSEQLNVSTDQTSQAAQVVAGNVDSVTAGTLQQIKSTKEAAETVVKMSETFQAVSTDSDAVARISEDAVQKAKLGEESVVSAMNQMETINETVNAAADVITNLGKRSNEIGQIVDTISDISNQTNLLALNASIEASRAGEHGKGFAVVANEVKKLAEQSKQAAGQIGELIKEIQLETDFAVNSINNGTQEVKKGSDVVKTAGVTFNEITSIVSRVSEQMIAISSSIQQLSSSTKQVVEIIQDVDEVAHSSQESFENVAAAVEEQTATLQEIASSSQELSSMAMELENAVSNFKI